MKINKVELEQALGTSRLKFKIDNFLILNSSMMKATVPQSVEMTAIKHSINNYTEDPFTKSPSSSQTSLNPIDDGKSTTTSLVQKEVQPQHTETALLSVDAILYPLKIFTTILFFFPFLYSKLSSIFSSLFSSITTHIPHTATTTTTRKRSEDMQSSINLQMEIQKDIQKSSLEQQIISNKMEELNLRIERMEARRRQRAEDVKALASTHVSTNSDTSGNIDMRVREQ